MNLISLKFLFIATFCLPLFAWQAPVSLVDLGTICDGNARVIGVNIDLTGITTSLGPAGLNAFVVTFDLDRSDVTFAARPGTSPALGWALKSTSASQTLLTSQITVVGWVADPSAPNTDYRICELVVSGSGGSLMLSLNASETSFGSRSLGTTPSEPILFSSPPPLNVTVPNQAAPALGAIVEAWLTIRPEFDVVAPMGVLDVRDLTQLINCGAS